MDSGYFREVKEIEIGQVQLRYAHTRMEWPEKVMALASSIERIGQILPVIVLREGGQGFVLLDGYLRVKALKRCQQDTVQAEIWEGKEEEALVSILARSSSRKWDVLEEAALLRELHEHYHLSQGRIASLVGRKQSWVSGRLSLYQALSDDLLQSIRKGTISTWAATRVIVPIARAIPAHGKALMEHLANAPLSTRELVRFFGHYQKANQKQRENMVRAPSLFLKALRAREEAAEANRLKEGIEGQWLRDLRVIVQLFRGLLKKVPALFYPGQSNLDRRILLTAFEDSKEALMKLEKQIRRSDDHPGNPASRLKSPGAGSSHPADQPTP